MTHVRTLVARFRQSLPFRQREEPRGTDRAFDNRDAVTSARAGDTGDGQSGGMPPPSWVKDYDEGRPRK